MKRDPLSGPKLKIERANSHVYELIAVIDAFWDSNPYELFTDVDAQAGKKSLKARLKCAPPDEISVIAGEILYGLRSALDQLACALAVLNGATKISDVYFPFGNDREHFETEAQKKIKRLSPEAAAMIAALKPYKGGNNLLWALHIINRVDKHQNLVVMTSAVDHISASMAIKPRLGYNFVEAPRAWQRADKDVLIASVPIGSEINAQVNLVSQVTLCDVEVVDGAPLLAALQQFGDLAKGVISIFEDRFFR